MARALLVSVRLHDARYHGAGAWPPSPARLYQALVSGAGAYGELQASTEALEWLETLPPPVVAAPRAQAKRKLTLYVPHNHAAGNEARDAKVVRPLIFDAAIPLVYVWQVDRAQDEGHAVAVCHVAERLYQLGRGIDMAWAWGEFVEDAEAEQRLARHPGVVYRPSSRGRGWKVPCGGSLASLEQRYARARFEWDRDAGRLAFRPPSPALFDQFDYGAPVGRRVYELRDDDGEAFAPWPLARATSLVERLRDEAVARLRGKLPRLEAAITRALVGRTADDSFDVPASSRIRIVPLPSIGHEHADHAVRRVMVECQPEAPLKAEDVDWAFSTLPVADPETGEVSAVLTSSADASMMRHFGIDTEGAHVWRTVTPAALPQDAARRRIEPTRKHEEAKDGRERAVERARAATAVMQALRHADVRGPVESVGIQREPFDGNGERAERFVLGTRFAKERLWHVEIVFGEPVSGPLVIGDGRFLGLGVMAPVANSVGIHAFAISSGLVQPVDAHGLTRALRRAVLARVQREIGSAERLPTFFTGHASDGAPTREVAHLAFVFDPGRRHLLIVAPHIADRRAPSRSEVAYLDTLDAAMLGLSELRAGRAGRLTLRASSPAPALFARSRVWGAVTEYQVTRHAKRVGASEALAIDVRMECRRRGLPDAEITVLETWGIPGAGLAGRARLEFRVAVAGPIMLGRTRYLGGGLFEAVAGAPKGLAAP